MIFKTRKEKFFDAIEAGDTQTVRRLLEGGDVDVNAQERRTKSHALTKAIDMENTGLVHFLIEAGANVNAANAALYTPLHMAATRGNVDLVNLLLDRGARINARSNHETTPIMNAVEQGHYAVAQALLQRGADANIASWFGHSCLIEAAAAGDADMVVLLLEAGADAAHTNDDGDNAAIVATRNGHLGIAERVLAFQSNRDLQAPGWRRNDENTVSHTYATADKRLTEVFNFAERERTTFSRNPLTGVETLCRESFNQVCAGTIKTAAEELKKLGGADHTGTVSKQKVPVKISA